MITRIELDGFKTFQNFELDLGPFQVIVGPNGAGKSNLFDAFRLLSNLVSAEVYSRYASGLKLIGTRGETEQLFTLTSKGEPLNRMRVAVEMLVQPSVTDRMGGTVQLAHTRLRYELHLKRSSKSKDSEEISITYESLHSIDPRKDNWIRHYKLSAQNGWLPTPSKLKANSSPQAFISTVKEDGKTKFRLHPDGEGGESLHSVDNIGSTVLASVSNTGFPHALAAQRELADFHFLQLNPDELRYSPFMRRRLIGPGYPNSSRLDLLETLRQMQRKDKHLLADVSRDLVALVPGTVKVELKYGNDSVEPVIWVSTQDGRSFTWQSISDGTLRLLALAVLANDPDFNGLFCMEEPENGVHPLRLNNIARLLKQMATDFSQPKEADEPLRQVLVSTHSPVLISQPEVVGALLFAYQVTSVQKGKSPMRITRISPVSSRKSLEKNDADKAKTLYYSLDQVEKYLSASEFEAAVEILEAGQIG